MKKTVCLWVCWLTLLLPASLEAQVDFSADTTSGCAPLLVSFTSQVPANATSVLWDFGNSGTSTQLNPGRSYTQPGTYTVTLTAYFASGPPQTQTKTAFINVFAAPSVDFSANPTTVCKGDPVAFTSNVTQGTGAITQYIWDFGDGTGSNQANPTHRYSQSGFYNVALTVEDANGCTAFEFKRVFINVEAPDASFTSSTTNGCFPPFQVRFQSAQTFGNHFWSFGNNLTSTTINPSHTYNSTGSFTVTHIIEVNGCRDTVTIPNYINIGQPTAQIQSSADTACVNQGIRFFCNSTTAQSVLWNFGPGQGSSTQCDPNKGFSTPGVYNVSLTLTEPNNCIINASKRIVILPPPPIDFGTPDTFACNPTHTATFTPVGATNLSLLWSFGDNNS
ncbi:MAG: PKD domain-containing protein, partial [Bacteroidota bacterium]